MIALIIAFVLLCLSIFTAMGSWRYYEEKLKRRAQELMDQMESAEAHRKKILTKRIAEERQAARAEAKRDMDAKMAEERKLIQEIIGRFHRLGARPLVGGAEYQVVVRFSRDMVLLCRHGDRREIEYLVEMLSHQIRRELVTLNFERFSEIETRARQTGAMQRQYDIADWQVEALRPQPQYLVRRGDPPE